MKLKKEEWIKNDKLKLYKFLDNITDEKIVVVQGLGFVGAVMSLVVANSKKNNYKVITVDIPTALSINKINKYNSGEFPIIASDKKIEEYYNNAFSSNKILATCSEEAFKFADIIIVDINLDVQKANKLSGILSSYSVDINPFTKAIKTIGENCKKDVLILIETTVPPGTTEKIVKPTIKKELNKRNESIDEIKIAHSYERVMPGPNYIDSIENFYRVFSGIDSKSEVAAQEFLESIISTKNYPLTKLGNTTSTEMAKVLENSFRAMNISFMVEWSRFAEEAGVNLWEVIDAIKMRPTHKNMMYPGIGVGGYCLTKDPLLADWAFSNLYENKKNNKLSKSISAVNTNDQMPVYAFNFLKSNTRNNLKNCKVLLFGVSYRSGVGDTRYSPVERFYDYLISEGSKVSIHDPYVTYWEEKNIYTDFNHCRFEDLKLNEYDIIIFSTAHGEYSSSTQLISLLKTLDKKFIIDLVGVLNEFDIKQIKNKNNIKVIGRGDI